MTAIDARALVEPLARRDPAVFILDHKVDLFGGQFSNLEVAAVFGAMAANPRHLHVVVTKNPSGWAAFEVWATVEGDPSRPYPEHFPGFSPVDICWRETQRFAPTARDLLEEAGLRVPVRQWPLRNVVLVAHAETQAEADRLVPKLPFCNAAVLGLSAAMADRSPGYLTLSGDAIHGFCPGCRVHGDFDHDGVCERRRIDWLTSPRSLRSSVPPGYEHVQAARGERVDWRVLQ